MNESVIDLPAPVPYTATSCDAWFEVLDAEGGIATAFVCVRSAGHDAPHARGEFRWWGANPRGPERPAL